MIKTVLRKLTVREDLTPEEVFGVIEARRKAELS